MSRAGRRPRWIEKAKPNRSLSRRRCSRSPPPLSSKRRFAILRKADIKERLPQAVEALREKVYQKWVAYGGAGLRTPFFAR